MRGPVWNFIQHLLEMSIAMLVGMFALGMPLAALFDAIGWSALNHDVVPETLVMATTMTIGMGAWMLFRGCGWRATGEMSLAMYVPFAMMYPFYFAGMVSSTAVMAVGHSLMVPAMIVVMLFRKDEYTQNHAAHKRAAREAKPAPADSGLPQQAVPQHTAAQQTVSSQQTVSQPEG